MPSLILHIGLGKTGTSALQHWFAANRNELEERGTLYPPMIDLSSAAAGKVTRGNGLPIALALRNPEVGSRSAEQTSPRDFARILLDAVGGFKGEVLLSSEAFQHFDPKLFREFANHVETNGYQIRVFCFVRPPVPFYTSVWLQHVKTAGHREGFADILDKYCGLQMQVVKKLVGVRDVLSGFKIFNYEDAQDDVVHFFLKQVLKLDIVSKAAANPRRVNISITDDDLKSALGPSFDISSVRETLEQYHQEMRREIEYLNSFVTGTPIEMGLPRPGF